jgi:hypothetical protein
VEWESHSGKYKRDDSLRSFLFSLRNPGGAIQNGQSAGDIGAVPALYREAARKGVVQVMLNSADVLEAGVGIIAECEEARRFRKKTADVNIYL